MPAHCVSVVDVRDFGAETVRVGDLNGDGAPDLLFIQSVFRTREITCLTATTILGEVLWQTGRPSPANGRIYSDLPVQVYDWDGDGCNEVVWVRQATYLEPVCPADGSVREAAAAYEGEARLMVLDDCSGEVKESIPLPAPADDSFLLADLTGRGRREDLVVKDRYWNMWGVSHEGETLWHWPGSVGHYPAIADVDGDGRDEVFVGFALIDDDGSVIFAHDPEEHHQDAAYIARLADGSWRLLFGNGGVHCLDVEGRTLWHHPLGEAQHVVAGRFRADSELQFAVVDRGLPRDETGCSTLYLYDLEGREIWRRDQPPGAWAAACVEVRWSDPRGLQELLLYSRGPEPPAVYDGRGEIVDLLPMQYTAPLTGSEAEGHFYATRADVWGDSREEVILFGSRGCCVWGNARPLAIPTLYNTTLYPGM